MACAVKWSVDCEPVCMQACDSGRLIRKNYGPVCMQAWLLYKPATLVGIYEKIMGLFACKPGCYTSLRLWSAYTQKLWACLHASLAGIQACDSGRLIRKKARLLQYTVNITPPNQTQENYPFPLSLYPKLIVRVQTYVCYV